MFDDGFINPTGKRDYEAYLSTMTEKERAEGLPGLPKYPPIPIKGDPTIPKDEVQLRVGDKILGKITGLKVKKSVETSFKCDTLEKLISYFCGVCKVKVVYSCGEYHVVDENIKTTYNVEFDKERAGELNSG